MSLSNISLSCIFLKLKKYSNFCLKYYKIYFQLIKIRVMILAIFTGVVYASFYLESFFFTQYINVNNNIDSSIFLINANNSSNIFHIIVNLLNINILDQDLSLILHKIILCTLVLFLSASSCGCLNMALEADIDLLMERTKNRPIPLNQISANHAFILGLILGVTSLFVSYFYLNLLTCLVVFFSIFIYIAVYTIYLKRYSTYDIIIGGISGALPCVIMSAGLSNKITLISIILFLIIFFWTPAHSYALGMHLELDYKRASIPLIHEKLGKKQTNKLILVYGCIAMIFASILSLKINFFCFIVILFLNIYFLIKNIALIKNLISPLSYFKVSIIYLFLLFLCFLLFNISKIILFSIY